MGLRAGKVVFFNNKKGWGIISASDGDFFVHHSNICDPSFVDDDGFTKFKTLKPNQRVSFFEKESSRELNIADKVVLCENL